MSKWQGKIGIVGAGSVGATIAYACMVRGIGKHISLYDVVKSRVEAECPRPQPWADVRAHGHG